MTFSVFKSRALTKTPGQEKQNLMKELPEHAGTRELLTQMARTSQLFDRLRKDGKIEYDEKGQPYYQGRRVIHEDSPIGGGVYLGNGEGEVIVVDPSKKIMRLYAEAKKDSMEKGKVDENTVMSEVLLIVQDAMKLDKKMVDAINERGAKNQRGIPLDTYIRNKAGGPIQYALLTGVLFELFKKEGHISGAPSIDRGADEKGERTWCRYTNSVGDVWIYDTPHDVYGPLGALHDHFILEKGHFDYSRPTDNALRAQLEAKFL